MKISRKAKERLKRRQKAFDDMQGFDSLDAQTKVRKGDRATYHRPGSLK